MIPTTAKSIVFILAAVLTAFMAPGAVLADISGRRTHPGGTGGYHTGQGVGDAQTG